MIYNCNPLLHLARYHAVQEMVNQLQDLQRGQLSRDQFIEVLRNHGFGDEDLGAFAMLTKLELTLISHRKEKI